MNELHRLLGYLDPEEVQNALAQAMMPEPRYDVAPMQQNTMRFESGPDQGRVVNLDFGGMPAQQASEKLGDYVQTADGRKGRYSANGREIVLADGSRVSLFPKADAAAQKADLAGRKALGELSYQDAQTRKLEQDIAMAQQREADGARERQMVAGAGNSEMEIPQPVLQKKYGKPPKDMQWTNDGRAVPIPGGAAETSAENALTGGAEMVRKIDEMIGKRDATGALLPDSKPHAGLEDAVGATWKPFARLVPGTNAADFDARLNEVKGGAFLKAYESLKGGGAITEIEGKKATDAITRMNLAQSEAEFVKAASEFRQVVSDAMDRMNARKSGAPAPAKEMQAPPHPAQYRGRLMEGPDGTRYRSDGQRWVRVG